VKALTLDAVEQPQHDEHDEHDTDDRLEDAEDGRQRSPIVSTISRTSQTTTSRRTILSRLSVSSAARERVMPGCCETTPISVRAVRGKPRSGNNA